MDDDTKSYQIRTKVEELLGNLADVMEPEEVLEFVESIAERMREEIDEPD